MFNTEKITEKYTNMSLPRNKNYCIYIHQKICGEVFYVGIGSNEKRPYQKINRNKFWKKLTKKHKNYTVTILKKSLSKDEACELEKTLINWFGRRDLGEGGLVNLTDGGESTYGRIMEQWQKDKMSKERKNKYLGKDNPNYGNNWSKEQRENMSNIQKERYRKGLAKINYKALEKGRRNKELEFLKDPSKKLKMAKRVSKNKSKYDYLKIDIITGDILEKFDTFMELKEKYPKIGKTIINSVCNGNKRSYRGVLWRYRCKVSKEIIIPKLIKRYNNYKHYYTYKNCNFLTSKDLLEVFKDCTKYEKKLIKNPYLTL